MGNGPSNAAAMRHFAKVSLKRTLVEHAREAAYKGHASFVCRLSHDSEFGEAVACMEPLGYQLERLSGGKLRVGWGTDRPPISMTPK